MKALDRRRLCSALWALVYAGTDAANVTEIMLDAYDDTSIQPPSTPLSHLGYIGPCAPLVWLPYTLCSIRTRIYLSR